MKQYNIKQVGFVRNGFDDPDDRKKIKEKPSSIIIYDDYIEALLNINECEYLDIIFWFHKSEGSRLAGITPSGAERGVFASRSPDRPNLLGVTTVKLLEYNRNTLVVEGLDAINNTPVIDIKCCNSSLFTYGSVSDHEHSSILTTDPRSEIRYNILSGKTDWLLHKAGQLHGHYCPGLAMGVRASAYAMKELMADSDGMENLLAITETNNCFSDGVQFITGCSFGNNALIFKDLGKTAFTLARRSGNGLRICARPESGDILQEAFPGFQKYFQLVIVEKNRDPGLVEEYKKISLQRAFGTLTIPFERLFNVQHLNIDIPDFAPIHESVICSVCKERVMKSRTIETENLYTCFLCKMKNYGILDGSGIHGFLI